MPGVITCPGLGDGDAAGICIPGVITCGVGDGDGRGCVARRLVLRRVRVLVVLFFGAGFGFGFAAGGLGMTCPSCCGKALPLTMKIKATAQITRALFCKLTGEFMILP